MTWKEKISKCVRGDGGRQWKCDGGGGGGERGEQ